MKSITVIGEVFGISGYARHTRAFAKELRKQHEKTFIDTQCPTGWEIGCEDWLFKAITEKPERTDVGVFIGLPHFAPMVWQNYDEFVQYVVWEGDMIPKFWVEYLFNPRVKQIWVPSEHVKQAIFNTIKGTEYSMDKVFVVPEGVDVDAYKLRENEHKDKENYTFLINKGWRNGINDRGGVQFALKAFTEEFGHDEKVKMIVKINPSYNGPGWNLDEELSKIGIKEKHPGLLFNVDVLSDDKIAGFYNLGDCFVSSTMAEGFGLTIAEAMSSGLPVVTTCFGGHTDFCKEPNLIVGDGEMVCADDGIQYEGVKWFKPSVKALREAMRRVFDNKDEFAGIGLDNIKLMKGFSWCSSVKKALEQLNHKEE